MLDQFIEQNYREVHSNSKLSGNIVKKKNVELNGLVKIEAFEDEHEGVKVILKKDDNDNVKEIKFVCSCGETKSIILDYNE